MWEVCLGSEIWQKQGRKILSELLHQEILKVDFHVMGHEVSGANDNILKRKMKRSLCTKASSIR